MQFLMVVIDILNHDDDKINMTTDKKNIAFNDIIRKGWNLLVENLGVADATRFIVSLERGKGDSVREIIEFWGNKTIENIHAEVLEAKEKYRSK